MCNKISYHRQKTNDIVVLVDIVRLIHCKSKTMSKNRTETKYISSHTDTILAYNVSTSVHSRTYTHTHPSTNQPTHPYNIVKAMRVDTHKMLPKLRNIKDEEDERRKKNFTNKETSEVNRLLRSHFTHRKKKQDEEDNLKESN